MTLEVGQMAPDFELLSDEGSPLRLSDLRGERILLFFYPKADTPGCTTQACGFRDNFPVIEASGTTVLGVSPDSVADLSRWRAKENLQYNLLSDPDHTVADQYGVWGEKNMYGNTYMGVIRSHFIIGADGRLEDVQYKISPQNSIDKALRQLAS